MKGVPAYLSLCAIILALLSAHRQVCAQSPSLSPAAKVARAEALYKEARRLHEAKDYAAACPKYEESQALDPVLSTEFYLAQCYEDIGKLMTAWSTFTQAANEAEKLGKPRVKAAAKQSAEALWPRLPKLLIVVSPEVAKTSGLVVKCNGADWNSSSWNVGLPVDPGEQTIDVTAPGKEPWQGKVEAKESAQVQIEVPELKKSTEVVNPPPPEGADHTPPIGSGSPPVPHPDGGARASRHITAVVVGVAGAAALGVGVATGVATLSNWKEAKTYCVGAEPKKCSQPGVDLRDSAVTYSWVSTIGVVLGSAGLIASPFVWISAPAADEAPQQPRAVWLIPAVDSHHIGVLVGGTF